MNKIFAIFLFYWDNWNVHTEEFCNGVFFGAAARGLMPSDRDEQRRDGGQFQLNLGDPSAPYFAIIFYHGNKHGCVNISVNVS